MRIASSRALGRSPVSSSYSRTPSEYTSEASVTSPPLICSGLAYSGVMAAAKRPDRLLASRQNFRIHNLGDAEIQQLGDPAACHQNIAGLDVAVDHAGAVRELHRGANRQQTVPAAPAVFSPASSQ